MIIGIDASRATSATPTGTETYSRELIRALIALDRKNRYRLYLRDAVSPDFFAPLNSEHRTQKTEHCLIPFPRFWTHFRLSLEMLTHAPDILWVPAHVLPPLHPRRSIVTVHDLGHLHFPNAHPPLQRLYHDWSTRWNVRAASHILADSEATRDDLVQLLQVPSKKISVVYPAYDAARFKPVRDGAVIDAVRNRLRVGKDYVLAIGTLHPRKNYARLIEAFSKLQITNCELIIVGKRGWLYASILQRACELNLESRVKFLDYVSSDDLPALISGARLVAFPSLHEGFGLPVLEAQACGTPVVCSMVSSLPEAAGDAALFFDPFDVDAIAGAIERTYNDNAVRAKLVERGFDNVKRFSWQVSARGVLDVIQRL
jgi:glycosyltransferase involved in cell wall biosynthesis